MSVNSSIKLTIAFKDPDLDGEEPEEQAQGLLAQMRDVDEIETVDRVLDPNPPEGNKAVGAIWVGLLTAQVNKENAQKLLRFLGDRLGNKAIELEVEANGKKLKVKATAFLNLVRYRFRAETLVFHTPGVLHQPWKGCSN